MTFKNLLLVRKDSIAILTLNRPDVLNALNSETITELVTCIRELLADDLIRVIILTGAGDRAFVAGADIEELARMTPKSAREVALRGQALCDLIETSGKPIIAAINGYALGGGLELAMSCTIRLASKTAQVGQPEINLGILPGYGGTQRLPRLVGPGRALEMLLTGESVTAEKACRLGIVNRVVADDQLRNEALKLGELLAGKPPVALRYILDSVRSGMQMSLREGCEDEATLFGLVVTTKDMREGTRAFLEKRAAEFIGQ